MLKTLTAILALVTTSAGVERNSLKPGDFHPLTELPWKAQGATLERILESLFLEPSSDIRYPLLAEYLRIIPVGQFSKAFDLCITLEGQQNPSDLVELLLTIWAERDPEACWDKTKGLFDLVGPAYHWLSYESWKESPKITVPNRQALSKSGFYLYPECLGGFLAVESSSMPDGERSGLLRKFANTWIDMFQSWPYLRANVLPTEGSKLRDLMNRRDGTLEFDRIVYNGKSWLALHEMAVRRLILHDPKKAGEYFTLARSKIPATALINHSEIALPSTGCLVLWAATDLPGLIKWADSPLRDAETALHTKAFLMSRVDAEMRMRWLNAASTDAPTSSDQQTLYEGWAKWDGAAALTAAAVTDHTIVPDILYAAAYGPFDPACPNARHFGIGLIKDFDLSTLPKESHWNIEANFTEIAEAWGEIDIGEAARFAYRAVIHLQPVPREKLISFFAGRTDGLSEDGLIDRTFCALRVWAACKPGEMKAWIATLKDPEMQKALAWLLENPSGSGKDAE